MQNDSLLTVVFARIEYIVKREWINMSMQLSQSALQRRMSRKFQVALVLEGAAVGLVAGGIVTCYRLCLSSAEKTLRQTSQFIVDNPIYLPLFILGMAIIMLTIGKLMLWEPYTAGSGIPQIDAEVAGKVDMPWHKVLVAKFSEGILCTLGGLSLGREGPSVQLGGMGGKAVSRALHKGRAEERILVTCGAGAGMAAAFHAPLTGVMFALEEIHKVFTAPLIISVTISSVVADYLVCQVLGVAPVLSLQFAEDLPHNMYLLVILMGITLGVLGAMHNKGMFAVQDLYKKLDKKLPYSRLLIAFIISGFAVFYAPDLICGGDAIVEIMDGVSPVGLKMLFFLLFGKYILTTISFGSGAPGGTLFPLVVMGSLCGAIFGEIAVSTVGMDSTFITNFMVLGIAGLFAGVIRAPVTGIVLAFELTGTLDSMLSAALVAIIAYVTANVCEVEPFYEKLYFDFLGRTSTEPMCDMEGEKILHTHIVEAGSFIEGKKIKDITWPDSMLVVTVKRAGNDMIANGDTLLEAADKVLVIMNLDEEDTCEREIRAMCRGVIGSPGR